MKAPCFFAWLTWTSPKFHRESPARCREFHPRSETGWASLISAVRVNQSIPICYQRFVKHTQAHDNKHVQQRAYYSKWSDIKFFLFWGYQVKQWGYTLFMWLLCFNIFIIYSWSYIKDLKSNNILYTDCLVNLFCVWHIEWSMDRSYSGVYSDILMFYNWSTGCNLPGKRWRSRAAPGRYCS